MNRAREKHGYSIVVSECALRDAALPAAAERQILKPVSEANANIYEFPGDFCDARVVLAQKRHIYLSSNLLRYPH